MQSAGQLIALSPASHVPLLLQADGGGGGGGGGGLTEQSAGQLSPALQTPSPQIGPVGGVGVGVGMFTLGNGFGGSGVSWPL